MTSVGYGVLALALAISIYTATASILGARRESPKLAESAQKGAVATAVLVTLASATFQILINPLVVWLWIGGGLLLLGTTVAIWPSEAQSSKFKAQSDLA
ncbi:MAG: hypothetical protein ACE5I2_01855 [Anaerolineae bacterium]